MKKLRPRIEVPAVTNLFLHVLVHFSLLVGFVPNIIDLFYYQTDALAKLVGLVIGTLAIGLMSGVLFIHHLWDISENQ